MPLSAAPGVAFEPGDLRDRLAGSHTNRSADPWAATALVVAGSGPDAAILFIERVTRASDPWSGQMALPGGRRDADETLEQTARRECLEEVGFDPGPAVGRLDDIGARVGGGTIATFVFLLDEQVEPVPDPREVAAAVWIGVDHLFDPANHVRYRYRGMGPFPGIGHGERVVWGLTHKILSEFAPLVDATLPGMLRTMLPRRRRR